jgi:hypothetical protein
MLSRYRRFRIGLLAFSLLALASTTYADNGMFGLRVGSTTDPDDVFVGAEALLHVDGNLYFNPNVEYVFRDGSTDLSLNGDFHLDFGTSSRAFFWLGAGIAGLYTNPDGPVDEDIDPGLNLIAGLGFRAGSAIPYIQPKFVVTQGDDYAMVAVGVRF